MFDIFSPYFFHNFLKELKWSSCWSCYNQKVSSYLNSNSNSRTLALTPGRTFFAKSWCPPKNWQLLYEGRKYHFYRSLYIAQPCWLCRSQGRCQLYQSFFTDPIRIFQFYHLPIFLYRFYYHVPNLPCINSTLQILLACANFAIFYRFHQAGLKCVLES